MKLDCLDGPSPGPVTVAPPRRWQVSGETQRLTDVLLCAPAHLAAVPCCAVTRDQLEQGFAVSAPVAQGQYRALRRTLEREGVTCHEIEAASGCADMCFTRDTAVVGPWGLIGLRPALQHRAPEAQHVLDFAAAAGVPLFGRVTSGAIEGGDICIARPGLLIVGCSGDRTDAAGAAALRRMFDARGWDVLVCRFDRRLLHLDTIFCMLDERRALACVEVLDEEFLAALVRYGIDLLPVSYDESQRLACNVVSLDGIRILIAAGNPRIERQLAAEGFSPIPVALSQFTACGGGVHCLTLPLRREPALPA